MDHFADVSKMIHMILDIGRQKAIRVKARGVTSSKNGDTSCFLRKFERYVTVRINCLFLSNGVRKNGNHKSDCKAQLE